MRPGALAALEVVGLEKVYDDGTIALRGIDLRVPAGAFYGLLGPNGSGKSTLIGMTTGLVRAPAGRIVVFGHDAVADAPRARLRVVLAPQEVHLDRFLSVREVLTYHGRYFGMAGADAEERAGELLSAFDLAAKAGARPNRLSGGMRRRLLIARALMHRPGAGDPRRADGRRRPRAAPRALALPRAAPSRRGPDGPAHDPLPGGGGGALRADRVHPPRTDHRRGGRRRPSRALRRPQPRGGLRGGDALMATPSGRSALRTVSIRGASALAGREIRRVLRLWTQTLMPPVVTALLFLAIFGGALGDRLRPVEGLSYPAFILPGLLVMTVAGQSFANASTSLFQAKNEGYLEDVLTSPLRPAEIALSYMAGGLVRGWLAAAAVAALALPFVDAGSPRPAFALLALALTGVIFSARGDHRSVRRELRPARFRRQPRDRAPRAAGRGLLRGGAALRAVGDLHARGPAPATGSRVRTRRRSPPRFQSLPRSPCSRACRRSRSSPGAGA